MKDILYINQIFNYVSKNGMLHRYFASSRKKCCVADIIDKYKTTHVYKKIKKEHSLKIVKIIQMKQKEIEDDENILKT